MMENNNNNKPSEFSLFQNLEYLKPIYKKFTVNAFDSWTSAKIIPKVGKFFIVRYTPATSYVQLIGNPMVNERVLTQQSLKDVTESREDLVNELKEIFSCINLSNASYTFEILYEEKKKEITFTDVYEHAGEVLQHEIYGKRLVYLNALDFTKVSSLETCNKCTVTSPDYDNLKCFLSEYYHHQQRKQGDECEDDLLAAEAEVEHGYWTDNRKRKTYWIRDLCETIFCRVIYTFKNEGKKEQVGRYAVIGNAILLEQRKHTVRKTDYKDLREVPKSLTEVIESFMVKNAQTREEFRKNVQSQNVNCSVAAAAQLAFINKVKASDEFQEMLQQYENGETVHEVSVLLVAAAGSSSSNTPVLEIFGYIKLDSVVKRHIQIPNLRDKTKQDVPSYLSWVAKPEDVSTHFKDITYFDGMILANCIVPERYSGSTVLLSCQSMKSFISTSDFLDDTDLKPFIQIARLPPIHKSSSKLSSQERRKRTLAECSHTELVEQVDRRVRHVSYKKARFAAQVMLCHVGALKEFFKEDEEREQEMTKEPSPASPSSAVEDSSSSAEEHEEEV